MSYFSDNYMSLRSPIAVEGRVGFRPAQLAAIHAISSHFFGSEQPAIVSMPTGAGKTTVLMATAFALRARRVLVLTPSRLVREQIGENFEALVDLKKVEALPLDLMCPRVFTAEKTIGSNEEWEALRAYDVVVATVPSVSPRDGVIPEPPGDLFDLVLVDEAHHAPARTWSRLLNLLSGARQVLFTATPFRRDEKEIKGRIVFSYDLRRAHEDRVFGDITFEPVSAGIGETKDVAIARATEAKFRADRAAGLKHLIMVRTDSLSRGKELLSVYGEKTGLNLAFVNGKQSLDHVKRVVARLKAEEIDGIVCVNMFGEGFNLPNLKIAAVHSPHKSLAVTLQFIGRFARAGQADIGRATFLAEPTESSAEIGELYEAGAVWRDIVQNLSGGRIAAEVQRRQVIDSFAVEAAPDMGDFSLYTVRPYFHAKVFAAPDPIDLTIEPDFPDKLQIIYRGMSDPHGAMIFITREEVRSPWCSDERFINVAYDVFIFHYSAQANLLFICASRRHNELYSRLARNLVSGRPRPLAHSLVGRALNDLAEAEFFSVGMRKRHRLGKAESYRMMAGPSADRAIQASDSRSFNRGHCFGKGRDGGVEVTIGVSSSSKVWSNTYAQIPELLEWCNRLSEKIASGRAPVTGSPLDLLSAGEELQRVPAGLVAAIWAPRVYLDTPLAQYLDQNGNTVWAQLLDFDFDIIESREDHTVFSIKNSDIEWRGIFSLTNNDLIIPASANEPILAVHVRDEDFAIQDFLNEDMPSFFGSDFSAIEGTSIFPMPEDVDLIPDNAFEVIDWTAANVDIEKEKPDGVGRRSIFEWIEERLVASNATVVFCDDGAGEIADFVALHEVGETVRIEMFHCKASGQPAAGSRVDDFYDVSGQAVKSSMYLAPGRLFDRLVHRVGLASIRGYVKGDETEAQRILTSQAARSAEFEIVVVQPGLRCAGRSEAVANLLASANHFLMQGGANRLGIIGS